MDTPNRFRLETAGLNGSLNDGVYYYIKLNHRNNRCLAASPITVNQTENVMENPDIKSIKNNHSYCWTPAAAHRYHVARDIGKAE
jgi:hypothetical protein